MMGRSRDQTNRSLQPCTIGPYFHREVPKRACASPEAHDIVAAWCPALCTERIFGHLTRWTGGRKRQAALRWRFQHLVRLVQRRTPEREKEGPRVHATAWPERAGSRALRSQAATVSIYYVVPSPFGYRLASGGRPNHTPNTRFTYINEKVSGRARCAVQTGVRGLAAIAASRGAKKRKKKK